tara:strand:+ start:477 stop:1028 length:552 start_codon:yes stop_codon:yes gene_type:complete
VKSNWPPFHIVINLTVQNLKLFNAKEENRMRDNKRWRYCSNDKDLIFETKISSAEKGHGQINDSFQTPLGRHYVRAMIGRGHEENAVFVGRRFTGELFDPSFLNVYPDRDWILTRILWLSGLEVGFNRSGNVDTMRRYIYIHGSPDSVSMGVKGSKGCIRMKNVDIIRLFDSIPIFTTVNIIL